MKTDDFKAEGDVLDFELSISKLAGRKIRDVAGYISYFGKNTVAFKITGIHFEDGSELGVEGEHDFPYITVYDEDAFPNFSDETLIKLDSENIAHD